MSHTHNTGRCPSNSVRCTCTPHRGLACRRCYAEHYEAGLHLVGLTRTTPQPPSAHLASLILGTAREPTTEPGKLAVRMLKDNRRPEHPSVRMQLDGLMTKLKDL